jgi:hypothetical protein
MSLRGLVGNIKQKIKLDPFILWQGTGNVGMAEVRKAHRILIGKPDGKSSLIGAWQCWQDNIQVDIKEKSLGCVLDLCGSGYGAVADSCGHENDSFDLKRNLIFLY